MRSILAERLLARIMEWGPEDVARERPIVQAMADYKYDEYQQFSPGMRFIESFALWLEQFKYVEERNAAYAFIKRRLVFCSQSEMSHFVAIAYPDLIRSILIRRCADEKKIPFYQTAKVIQSDEFKALRRQSLFLALSDGGKIDIFRRSNPELTHEQIFHTHELTPERAVSMLTELRKKLVGIHNREVAENDAYFKMIFLLDDFSGSGITNLRKSPDGVNLEGKIAKFLKTLTDPNFKLQKLIRKEDLRLGVILYYATERAIRHLDENLKVLAKTFGFTFNLSAVQIMPDAESITETFDPEFYKLAQTYYDHTVEDEHTKKGGTDIKLGFSSCALPLVLFHNTPNNSAFLLWSSSMSIRGVFPRVTRHVGEQ